MVTFFLNVRFVRIFFQKLYGLYGFFQKIVRIVRIFSKKNVRIVRIFSPKMYGLYGFFLKMYGFLYGFFQKSFGHPDFYVIFPTHACFLRCVIHARVFLRSVNYARVFLHGSLCHVIDNCLLPARRLVIWS